VIRFDEIRPSSLITLTGVEDLKGVRMVEGTKTLTGIKGLRE
jgi:hypothetical protein